MKFINVIIIILFFSLFYNCSSKNESNLNNESGNNNESLLKIKTKFIFSISSNEISEEKGFYVITDFIKDNDGTIYLSDQKNVRIMRLNKDGKILNYFLKKGEGPGEFYPYFTPQLTNNYLWVIGRKKIAKFKKNGEYIEEYKLKNFYSSIIVLNDKNFLAFQYSDIPNQKLKFEKILGLFEFEKERLVRIYYKGLNLGKTYIQRGKSHIALFLEKGIMPDIIYTYDFINKKIFICKNDEYKIYIKNLIGVDLGKLKKNYQLIEISNKYKKKIVDVFGNIGKELKDQINKKIPTNFCAIKDLNLLNNHYLFIHRIKKDGAITIDMFDTKKRSYITSFDLLPEIANKEIKIIGNVLSVIDSSEENTYYKEYKVVLTL